MTRVSSETRVAPLENGCAAPAEAAHAAPQQSRAAAAAQQEAQVAPQGGWRAKQGAQVAQQDATQARPSHGWRPSGPASDVAQPAPARAQAQHAPNATTFATDLTRWEGSTRHMYVDTRGHVTTGIGHLLRDANAAAALPWLHRTTGAPATPAEIHAAFARVAAQPARQPASNYERFSDLVLPPNLARDMAMARLQREFLPGIRRLCPGFDGYPQPAQRALVDMAYNLGVGGLARFPKMLQACERGDFAAAAGDCNRRSCRADRNEATRELFMAAAHLTNAVQAMFREVRP